MARLYSNENFPLPVVEELRRLRHDVRTIQETGRAGEALPDAEVLAQATADGRAVLTFNRKHFLRIHRERSDHAGVIACTLDVDFIGQALRIELAVRDAGDLGGQLIRVNRP